jgi:NTE family protein
MAQRNVKRARAGTLGDGDGEHAGAAAGVHTGRHIQLPPVRNHRADAARRRRAGRLSGRRVSGPPRGRHSSELDCRNLDRRAQHGDHCRQCAGGSRDAAARILGDDLSTGFHARRCRRSSSTRCSIPPTRSARLSPPRRPRRDRRRAEGILRAALSAAHATVSGPPQNASYYDTSPAEGDARETVRFRPDQLA